MNNKLNVSSLDKLEILTKELIENFVDVAQMFFKLNVTNKNVNSLPNIIIIASMAFCAHSINIAVDHLENKNDIPLLIEESKRMFNEYMDNMLIELEIK